MKNKIYFFNRYLYLRYIIPVMYMTLLILIFGGKVIYYSFVDGLGVGNVMFGLVLGLCYSLISHFIVLKGNLTISLKNIFSWGWYPFLSLGSILFILLGVIYEEVFWRLYIQSLLELKYGKEGCIISAVMFFMIHYHFFKRNDLLRIFDLVLFSIVVSIIWSVWMNIYYVIAFHYIRNHISVNLLTYHQ